MHSLKQKEVTDSSALRREFIRNGLINVTNFFSKATANQLSAEMKRLLISGSRRNDFLSKHTNNSPRNMNTIGERTITKKTSAIEEFYYSSETKYMLSRIAGELLYDLPWTGERFVVNALTKEADTHGWHWDDYAYALVFIAECPPKENGGLLQSIPHTYWNKKNPGIDELTVNRTINTNHFSSLSFYLMRSDTTLHRVTSIAKGSRRLSLAMSYCNENDLAKNINHKTVNDLYDI